MELAGARVAMKKVGTVSDQESSKSQRPAALETVLYVEDDDDNWKIARLRLGSSYAMLRAKNALEACQILAERGPELSAILMDIGLMGSDLNGIEITELVRGKLPAERMPAYAKHTPVLSSTPIIFVTAHGAKYSDGTLLLAGGDRVIPKPVDFVALNLALTQLALKRSQRRED